MPTECRQSQLHFFGTDHFQKEVVEDVEVELPNSIHRAFAIRKNTEDYSNLEKDFL